MKLISWNIDSLNAALTSDSNRAVLSREVLDTIFKESPDVLALQETKLPVTGPTKKHIKILEEYWPDAKMTWRVSEPPARKGYSGTMFLYKDHLNPIVSQPRLGAPTTMDDEGRILTLEFPDFFITQVYTPNAGDGLMRLEDRQIWDRLYADYLSELDKKKPVIACGDFNVAHREIDLANPDTNHLTAGFTDEEREGFSHLLDRSFVDTFRYKHGDVTGVYTWWSQRVRTSKVNNAGWRIDYWLVSDRLKDKVLVSDILDSGTRQDHTPIVLEMDMLFE